jgi:GH15 family glucan-1,4-alpha-glucosidase
MSYPPIAEHGVVGNLHTVALISANGTVDWYCSPRFDSPSMFAALLDTERGGRFVLRPAGGEWHNRQLYLPDTNVLITRFLTPGGSVRSRISCRSGRSATGRTATD